MARLSKQEIAQIVAKELPGYEIVTVISKAAADSPDSIRSASTPDISSLKRKYLGEKAAAEFEFNNIKRSGGSKAFTHDEMLVVAPKDSTSDARIDQSKVIVISAETKRIISEQG